MTLTNGNALMGRLAKSVFDKNVPLWLNSPVRELILKEGAVIGAKVEKEGSLYTVYASRGVVLAAGGFSHDIKRRSEHYPHTPTGKEHWSPTAETNTGDSLNMFENIGGRVDSHLPNAAAWAPNRRSARTLRRAGSARTSIHWPA